MFRKILQVGGLVALSLSMVIPIASAQDTRMRAASRNVSQPWARPTMHLIAPPKYLVLRQSAGGVAQPSVGRPYAYGWFGVAPRRHTITHQGYYGSHWLMPGRISP